MKEFVVMSDEIKILQSQLRGSHFFTNGVY